MIKFTSCFAHGRWFPPGTPPSSTTKTGRHDIAEILLKVELSTKYQKNHSIPSIIFSVLQVEFKTNITQFDMICLVFETKIRQHKYATWQWDNLEKKGGHIEMFKNQLVESFSSSKWNKWESYEVFYLYKKLSVICWWNFIICFFHIYPFFTVTSDTRFVCPDVTID